MDRQRPSIQSAQELSRAISERATIERAEIFEADLSNAGLIPLFLLPRLNVKQRTKLLEMKPWTCVVSNSTDIHWRLASGRAGGSRL